MHARSRRFATHVLFEITVGEFQTNFSVVWIEVGDLVKNVERFLVIAGTRVGIGDYQILRARVVN